MQGKCNPPISEIIVPPIFQKRIKSMFLFFRYKVKDHVKTLSFHSCHQANFKKWEAAINRKDFQVSKSTRVCSNHFIHAKPTESHPIPSLFM